MHSQLTKHTGIKYSLKFTTEDGHEWPQEQANLHSSKLFLHVFVLGLQTEDLNVS